MQHRIRRPGVNPHAQFLSITSVPGLGMQGNKWMPQKINR